jgi:hypothetical protein
MDGAAMDEWIVWEVKERVVPRGKFDHLFFSLSSLCKGDSYSATCAQRNTEGGEFLI